MISFIFGLVLLAILLVALSAQKTYNYVPIKELRRQARQGDDLAKVLYGAVSYGFSLRAFLWLVIALSAAGSFMLFQVALPGWLTFLVLVFVLLLAFVWLPSSHLSRWGARLVATITPPITKLLHFAHPAFERVAHLASRYRPLIVHTGLYEREDIVDLLKAQGHQADNRIQEADLRLAEHALTFGDKLVRDIMTPRRMVKAVKLSDSVGPILMEELHESGHSRFPVYGEGENVVGILYLRDVIDTRKSGSVETHMHHEVYYVHEDHALRQVLHAFLKTKHQLFIVVNEFEEYVGLITIEDVLEQIVGQPIVDEFDQYDDLRAVAASQAAADHKTHKEQEAVVE